ncbi:MAG TPA: thioesterase family protein [Pirellulaceae bacterium]|nr:thioesterase family protein [Pirellulaceae bacterium]
MPQQKPFRTSRRVEFCDTDAAGILHFSAFFQLMEQAEHELLRSVGLSVVMSDDQGKISWPRVSAKCDFRSAVHFEEELAIDVSIGRLGTKSVTYAFAVTCQGRDVAAGEITSVCCRLRDGQPPEPIAIPDWFRQKLSAFL